MALGSSAPEIMLNVIETVMTLGSKPGELGASTIVGSVAFNLLVISGVSIMAVTPETDEEEREAILAAMNGHKNLETFIYETLPDEQEYFVIEKDFWESWCTALAITQDGKYLIKKEHKDFIDNKKLMMEMHQFRMKDLTYKQDFVLLPKYVYHPLSKWYSCEKEITRTVI